MLLRQKMYNLNPNIRKHQTNPNWGTFQKMTGLSSSKVPRSRKWRKEWETISDKRKSRRHVNKMKCVIFELGPFYIKDIMWTTSEIWMKAKAWAVAIHQCYFLIWVFYYSYAREYSFLLENTLKYLGVMQHHVGKSVSNSIGEQNYVLATFL